MESFEEDTPSAGVPGVWGWRGGDVGDDGGGCGDGGGDGDGDDSCGGGGRGGVSDVNWISAHLKNRKLSYNCIHWTLAVCCKYK